ncbi:hypothetical protein PTSG_01714 [Salpingoeca rosetta]|uniref:UFSP1/2/DUB catalytic domain-containing protein n=1 Tax=Salpingoeca rosetta (strain ATCC 50818 / BSB-021) TaxID=946362 RepID=F2TYR0_SALR5|nr:uncharacterized protein PTSG_01714 [Salpingoeca rosetta]EGD78734.1 hypothetical protein PTSG_01714 [Salpingoeca rosetta]|eukprot:XP_004997691.1 hypothetical protein PTSG_01714 [Salpingoeca rosetta]
MQPCKRAKDGGREDAVIVVDDDDDDEDGVGNEGSEEKVEDERRTGTGDDGRLYGSDDEADFVNPATVTVQQHPRQLARHRRYCQPRLDDNSSSQHHEQQQPQQQQAGQEQRQHGQHDEPDSIVDESHLCTVTVKCDMCGYHVLATEIDVHLEEHSLELAKRLMEKEQNKRAPETSKDTSDQPMGKAEAAAYQRISQYFNNGTRSILPSRADAAAARRMGHHTATAASSTMPRIIASVSAEEPPRPSIHSTASRRARKRRASPPPSTSTSTAATIDLSASASSSAPSSSSSSSAASTSTTLPPPPPPAMAATTIPSSSSSLSSSLSSSRKRGHSSHDAAVLVNDDNGDGDDDHDGDDDNDDDDDLFTAMMRASAKNAGRGGRNGSNNNNSGSRSRHERGGTRPRSRTRHRSTTTTRTTRASTSSSSSSSASSKTKTAAAAPPRSKLHLAVSSTLHRGCVNISHVPVSYSRPRALVVEEHAGYDGVWSAMHGALLNAVRFSKIPSEFTLCRFARVFGQSGYERLWSCGYRNMQTMTDALMARDHFSRRLYGGCGQIPALSALQRELEAAWYSGFDPDGAAQFGYKVSGTGKWIGTTEVCALLRYYGLDAHVATFVRTGESATIDAYEGLVDWVWHYLHFSHTNTHKREFGRVEAGVHVSEMPPLYFQHDGHSRTVVGMERKQMKNGSVKVNLLVLDPLTRPQTLHKSLLTGGWEKYVKRGLHTLHKPSYQLVFVRGVMDKLQRERSKSMRVDSGTA